MSDGTINAEAPDSPPPPVSQLHDQSGIADVAAPKTPVEPPQAEEPKGRKLIWVVLIVLLLVVAAGTVLAIMHASNKKSPAQPALTKVSVRLEWVNNPQFAGMYVAKDKGFYKAEGLDVNLKEFTDGSDMNKEVSSGAVDYAVTTPLEVILARDNGEKTKAVAAIYQTSPYSIVSLKSDNIKTPADFKGKTLGNVGDNSEAKVTYAALMANVGLAPADVTIKTEDFDIIKNFKERLAQTADIFRTDQTYVLDQAGIQYSQIFPEQFGFSIYGDVLIASDAKIDKEPAQVAAFTRATLKGWQYVLDHPREALTITSHHANEIYKDPLYQKYVLDNTIPLVRTTANQHLGEMQYVYWNRAYNGVKEAGLLKTTFSTSDTYTTRFVR